MINVDDISVRTQIGLGLALIAFLLFSSSMQSSQEKIFAESKTLEE